MQKGVRNIILIYVYSSHDKVEAKPTLKDLFSSQLLLDYLYDLLGLFERRGFGKLLMLLIYLLVGLCRLLLLDLWAFIILGANIDFLVLLRLLWWHFMDENADSPFLTGPSGYKLFAILAFVLVVFFH